MQGVFTILTLAIAAAACPSAFAQQAVWQQCGGINWTGVTSCASGSSCTYQNPYYSQCLPLSNVVSSVATSTAISSIPPVTSSTTIKASTTIPITPTTTAVKTSTSTSASSSSPAASSTSPATSGITYKTSVTHYGAGDSVGSPNCNTNTAACGFFTSPGFSAAVSQNLYGVGPGAGAGPACGTCWKITGETDSSGNALSNAGTSIVVMVNNLCPADGNPLCAQSGLTGTNQYGANVNFDLCSDSGASAAFFGSSGVGLAIGTATQVSCSEYSGTVVD